MSRVTLDLELRARLNGLNEPLEICDESGRTLGHFLPEQSYQSLLYQVAEAQCPYSADELRDMRQESGARPLAELWRSLGQS